MLAGFHDSYDELDDDFEYEYGAPAYGDGEEAEEEEEAAGEEADGGQVQAGEEAVGVSEEERARRRMLGNMHGRHVLARRAGEHANPRADVHLSHLSDLLAARSRQQEGSAQCAAQRGADTQ